MLKQWAKIQLHINKISVCFSSIQLSSTAIPSTKHWTTLLEIWMGWMMFTPLLFQVMLLI